MGGREPARSSREVGVPGGMLAPLEGMTTSAWTALSGDVGRLLVAGSGERRRRFFGRGSDMLWLGEA